LEHYNYHSPSNELDRVGETLHYSGDDKREVIYKATHR